MSRRRKKRPHPLPLSPRKKRSGRGERSKLFRGENLELSPLPERFLRGERGKGVRAGSRLEGFILYRLLTTRRRTLCRRCSRINHQLCTICCS